MCLSSGWTAWGPGWASAPNEYFFRAGRWNWRSFMGPIWVGKKGCRSSSAGMECYHKSRKCAQITQYSTQTCICFTDYWSLVILYNLEGFCPNIYRLHLNSTHSHLDQILLVLSLHHIFSVYLNDVTTKCPPQALLLRVIELIIGEVPGILHFRLRHVLRWQKQYFSLKRVTFKCFLNLNWIF